MFKSGRLLTRCVSTHCCLAVVAAQGKGGNGEHSSQQGQGRWRRWMKEAEPTQPQAQKASRAWLCRERAGCIVHPHDPCSKPLPSRPLLPLASHPTRPQSHALSQLRQPMHENSSTNTCIKRHKHVRVNMCVGPHICVRRKCGKPPALLRAGYTQALRQLPTSSRSSEVSRKGLTASALNPANSSYLCAHQSNRS